MTGCLNPGGYERWLGLEPDPRDLLVPFASEPMTIWPISRRVNSPDNDDERLLRDFPANRYRGLTRGFQAIPDAHFCSESAQTPGVSGMNISRSPSA